MVLPENWLVKLLINAIPLIFAITLHEVAHGLMALQFGDDTAKMRRRLSLNPIRHIDPIGTLLIPGILLITTGYVFGWAKPVPVVWHKLQRPDRDMVFVALAGPIANLAMAVVWTLFINFKFSDSPLFQFLFLMGISGLSINLFLAVLNLLPIPPLDGSRVLAYFMGAKQKAFFALMETYGFIILLALMFTGILTQILVPIVLTLRSFLISTLVF